MLGDPGAAQRPQRPEQLGVSPLTLEAQAGLCERPGEWAPGLTEDGLLLLLVSEPEMLAGLLLGDLPMPTCRLYGNCRSLPRLRV